MSTPATQLRLPSIVFAELVHGLVEYVSWMQKFCPAVEDAIKTKPGAGRNQLGGWFMGKRLKPTDVLVFVREGEWAIFNIRAVWDRVKGVDSDPSE